MKKRKLINTRRIIMILFLIIIIISIILVVDYNIKEQNKEINNTTNVVKEAYSFLTDIDASELNDNSLVTIQNNIKEDLNKKLKEEYTLDNPLIVTDPYGLNPLSAYIIFKTDNPLSANVVIKGQNNDDISFSYAETVTHCIPVYFLYSNYDNKVVITLSDETTKELTITIKDNIDKSSVTGSSNKFYTVSGENIITYDSFGNPRMKLAINSKNGVKELSNGNLLISSEEFGGTYDTRSSLIEITPMGEIINKYNLKNSIHGEAIENTDSNIYVLTTNTSNEQVLILIDRTSGEILQEYNINTILNTSDLEVNGVSLMNDNILLSIRNKNTIISLNKNGEINWIFGDYTKWDSSLKSYFLRKTTYITKYPNGISNISYKDGLLYVFDDNYDILNKEEIDCNTYKSRNSYLRVYSINEKYKTIKATKNIKLNNYSVDNSNVIPGDVNLISQGTVIGDSVDTSNYECNNSTIDSYKTVIDELNNKNKINYEMITNYESKNTIIYTIVNNNSYTLKDGTDSYQLTNQVSESLEDTTVNTYRSGETKGYELTLSTNYLRVDELFDNSDSVSIAFLNPNGTAYKYTYKEANKYQNNYIDISLLEEGKYFIYIIEGEKVYNSNIYIIK